MLILVTLTPDAGTLHVIISRLLDVMISIHVHLLT